MTATPHVLDGVIDDGRIIVDWIQNPFEYNAPRDRFAVAVAPDARPPLVSDVIAEAASRYDAEAEFRVFVGGVEVTRAWHHIMRIKRGQSVRIVGAVLGSSFAKIAGLVLAIGAIALAPYLAPVVVSAVGATGLGASLVTAGVGAALSAGAAMATRLLFPPPSPTALPKSGATPAFQITGIGNQLRPNGTVPDLHGGHRVFFDLAAKPYFRTRAGERFGHFLFIAGYGDVAISDLRIGDSAIGQFDDVDVEIIRNTVRPKSPLFPRSVDEIQVGATLEKGVAHVRRTSGNVGRFTVEVELPSGSFVLTRKGKTLAWPVRVHVEYREVGSPDWITAPSLAADPTRFGVVSKDEKPISAAFRVNVPTGTYDVRVTKTSSDADSLTPAEEDANEGARIVSTVVWTVLDSEIEEDPILFDRAVTVVAVRIRASNQISGGLDRFNGLCVKQGLRFNGSSWVAGAQVTAADAYVTFLKSGAHDRPLTDDEIDYPSIEAFHARCLQFGWRYDRHRDFAASTFEAANEILSVGRGRVDFPNGKWGVLFDAGDQAPILHNLTPANIGPLRGEKSEDVIPHAFRIRFINAAMRYLDDEITVYRDGFTEATARIIADLTYPGIVNAARVWQRARYDMRQARAESRIWTFSVNGQWMAMRPGDRARLTHPAVEGQCGGWIEVVSGTDLTLSQDVTLAADETYQMILTSVATGDAITATVTTGAGTWRTVAVSTATGIVAGDGFALGLVGEVSREVVIKSVVPNGRDQAEVTVFAARPDDPADDPVAPPDFVSSVPVGTAPERVAPRILTARVVTVPTAGGFAASIEIVAASAGLLETAEFGGRWRRSDLSDDVFTDFTVSSAGRATLPDVIDGSYQIQVRTRATGYSVWSAWSDAVLVVSDAQGTPPEAVPSVDAIPDKSRRTVTFDATPPSDFRRARFVIRWSPLLVGATKIDGADLATAITSFPVTLPLRSGTYFFDAVSFYGVESEVTRTVILPASLTDDIDVVETLAIGALDGGGTDWTGTFTGTIIESGRLRLAHDGEFFDGTDYFDGDGDFFGPLAEVGYFEPTATTDLGQVFDVDLGARLDAYGFLADDEFFNGEDFFGDGGDFFGAVNAADFSVVAEVKFTSDDPAGSPVWSDWQAVTPRTVRARAFRCRLVLRRFIDTVSPSVRSAAFVFDLPERTYALNNQVVAAIGQRFDFPRPFFRLAGGPLITVQGGTAGDRLHQITDSDETGFFIRCFDPAGAGVERTIDLRVTGIGERQT